MFMTGHYGITNSMSMHKRPSVRSYLANSLHSNVSVHLKSCSDSYSSIPMRASWTCPWDSLAYVWTHLLATCPPPVQEHHWDTALYNGWPPLTTRTHVGHVAKCVAGHHCGQTWPATWPLCLAIVKLLAGHKNHVSRYGQTCGWHVSDMCLPHVQPGPGNEW